MSCLPDFFVILDFWCCWVVFSSTIYRSALAKTVLPGQLSLSFWTWTSNILGQGEPCYQSSLFWGKGIWVCAAAWEQLDRPTGLVLWPSEALGGTVSCLGFLVRLTRWLGGWELDLLVGGAMNSLPWIGRAAGQAPRHAPLVWGLSKTILYIDFPSQLGPPFCLHTGIEPGYFLFNCHCNKGCWMGYIASYVPWLGFPVRWAEAVISNG